MAADESRVDTPGAAGAPSERYSALRICAGPRRKRVILTDQHRAAAAGIAGNGSAIAAATVAHYFARRPTYLEGSGALGKSKLPEDANYHLSFLRDSVCCATAQLFTNYVGWAKVLLAQRQLDGTDLVEALHSLQHALQAILGSDLAAVACKHIDAGLGQLPQMPADLPTCVDEGGPLASLTCDYLQALLRGDRHAAGRLVIEAVDAGVAVKDIYLHVFQESQYEVGRLWQLNRISVAQEHYCSAATQFIMSLLYPHIFNAEKNGHVMVAACVAGDLHEIGLRIITDFLEIEGWDTFYLGASTPASGIIDALLQRQAHVLALSATMTFHVHTVAEVIHAVRAEAACHDVRIIVGGYPFNVATDLWRTVGADAYAADAGTVVGVVDTLVATGASSP